MPKRKKTNLSQNSNEAKRKRHDRSQESSQDRALRLSGNSQRNADARRSETFTQRLERLAANQQRNAQARATETTTQRSERLARNRFRNAEARAMETVTQRSERLAENRERIAEARAMETMTQRTERLAGNRERNAEARALETSTQRSERLAENRERNAEARATETLTQRTERLARNRERNAEARATETLTQRTERLAENRERNAEARALETSTQRSERLAGNRDRNAEARALETSTQRSERLRANRERNAQSRVTETFTQRSERLLADRERHSQSRAAESDLNHVSRLESVRLYNDCLRENRNEQLSLRRERVRNSRRLENAEDRHVRLQADIFRNALNRSLTYTDDEDDTESETVSLSWIDKEGGGFSYSVRIKYSEYAKVGKMDRPCNHCHALKWPKESAGFCCAAGKIKFDLFQDPLRSLLTGEHQLSKEFLKNVRSYNAAFQMTSLGAKEVVHGSFMPTFKIQGQVYHLIGSLLPEAEPKYLQVYFVSDYQEQVCVRNRHFPGLNTGLISALQDLLHRFNPYVTQFKAAMESVPADQQNNYKFVISADKRPLTEHRGRHNAPTANEVAVVLVDQQCDKRDIVLRARDNRLQRISETHRSYDALQYPLIFCRGEDGYNFAVRQVDPSTGELRMNKKATALQFYCYVLQIRHNQFAYIQRFRGLFSQFIVDMYAKIETERLVFIRTHQRQLRAENYVDLRDAVRQDTDVEHMGRLVILPSSFTGSPRNMHEQVQDALSYVRKYGKPDLFITVTTNPKWTEITQELLEGQAPYDRHDIISRVFHLKLKLLIHLLTKEKLFGASICFTYNVEWQKRGLPHAHILLWLKEKIRPHDVDSLISAEFPNPTVDPDLYEIVKTHMIHGPCGALNNNSPCMRDGQCTKKYPRALLQETVTGDDGYPKYRRRAPDQGGFVPNLRVLGQEMEVNNSWVVPYSPVLSKTFQGHINVELCSSIKSIKYIFKYVNKGPDQATLATSNERDEVTQFQAGRYISSSEAAWRIYSFPIYERFPPVVHLDVHVEGGQRVYFDPGNVMQQLENPRQTTLLAFFQLCQIDDFAKNLLYDEVPAYYTYDKQHGRFNRRRRGTPVEEFPSIFKEHVIGRVFTVHPNNTECFYVRLLLHNVKGPTSFTDLKTYNGVEYSTFQAACRARGLLEDDQHWDDALAEASLGDCPRRLRHLFAIMLVFCSLSNANELWIKYQNNLAEDFLRTLHLNNYDDISDIMRNFILNRCLCELQEIVLSIGGNPLSQYGLPEPAITRDRGNSEYTRELDYDCGALAIALEDVTRLTSEQREIFERICNSVFNALGEVFFLDAPGGTGKTFLTKLILAKVRSQGKIALAVASSGIAATLLPVGKTAHSMLKIPIQLEACETPVCDISRNSEKARVLRESALIIWDECTMAHRKAVEAVNRTLQDIRHSNQLMGGVTMLFCGDFRQILPVVTRGTRADEVNASLKSSTLFSHVTRLNLTTNMRARAAGNPNAEEFSSLLLSVGEGRYPQVQGSIMLTDNLCTVVNNIDRLISSVYGDPAQIINRDDSWLCERAILAPRNAEVGFINCKILDKIQGEYVSYIAVNRVVDEQDTTAYPIEFLNSLEASGLPDHKIKLKVGIPIILMRNLSPPKLCNGTRLRVVALQKNIVEATILTGCGTGERVLIPRIPLIPNNYPFRFKRVQLPVSVAFAMSINKAQGQTLRRAGVDLTHSCFAHGQLYVALSRVSSAKDLFVYAPGDKTHNVVYHEAL